MVVTWLSCLIYMIAVGKRPDMWPLHIREVSITHHKCGQMHREIPDLLGQEC